MENHRLLLQLFSIQQNESERAEFWVISSKQCAVERYLQVLKIEVEPPAPHRTCFVSVEQRAGCWLGTAFPFCITVGERVAGTMEAVLTGPCTRQGSNAEESHPPSLVQGLPFLRSKMPPPTLTGCVSFHSCSTQSPQFPSCFHYRVLARTTYGAVT